ncbi:MAG: thioredoxin-disulfide reductase [Planctomycetota bacterium]
MAEKNDVAETHDVLKVVVIGSGPAGWTACIYAARANLKPVCFEGAISEENRLAGTLPLGQLNWTTDVENFPGWPEGVLGPDLMLKMRQQAETHGTTIHTKDVTKLDLSQRPFRMEISDGSVIHSHTVILATGASAQYLGLDSERKFMNEGVSACAVCDGALPRFRDKQIVVVGGGDTAMEEASHLAKFGSKIYVVHRRDQLRASAAMQERVLNNPKVEMVWNHVVDEVLGNDNDGVTGVRVKHVETGDTKELEATGMFLAIGHRPNTKFLDDQLATDENGFIELTSLPQMNTSIEGVYAAGDVADPDYKQAVTAAGMGCKAALDAERWLAEQGLD